MFNSVSFGQTGERRVVANAHINTSVKINLRLLNN
jgi:hypothetical protein